MTDHPALPRARALLAALRAVQRDARALYAQLADGLDPDTNTHAEIDMWGRAYLAADADEYVGEAIEATETLMQRLEARS